ncbi:MAG TPA: alpha/beta hydrolase, partial [Nitrosomonas sp.]|nr:alpha/beta hydrolase [Nitrosomonas sp.]
MMKLKPIFAMPLIFLLISCNTQPVSPFSEPDHAMRGDQPFEVAAVPALPPAPAFASNYAVMNVFFATDRKENKTDDIKKRFGKERGELVYGVTQISIPRNHATGETESPSIWRFEFRENTEKHIVMLGIENLDKESYFQAISQKVKNSAKKSAFLFIHGFNVTFEDAARRTGQIYYDLGFDGVAAFYSWPSHGVIKKYVSDEANIEWSQRNIEMFLEDFSEKSNAENIYLIAHSMGNRALTRAYISLVKNNPVLKSRIKEIILAAPDIDA